jgi:hypothetical protein
LINGLLDGRSPVVRHYGREGGHSEVRCCRWFQQGVYDYQLCTTKLLPMNSIRSPDPGRLPGAASSWMRRPREADSDAGLHEGRPTVNHIELTAIPTTAATA